MPQKPRIIYNPAAGKGSAGKELPKVRTLLNDLGFDYDLILTESPGHAQLLSRRAAEDGCSMVVAAGGDGTINETINGLMEANVNGNGRPVLGVLPIGSGNDFAFGAGIPHSLEEACHILVNGQRRKIDVGHVVGGNFPQGRYFGNGVGLGFDTVVGFEAAKIRWLHGAASYLAALVKTIFLYAKAPVYEVNVDGRVFNQPFLMVSIMNGRRMGGAFLMAPDSTNDDGTFDLCLAGNVPQLLILPVAMKFLKGTQAEDPKVQMVRGNKISIRAVSGIIPAHADGETVCTAGRELQIDLHPGALEVVSHANGVNS